MRARQLRQTKSTTNWSSIQKAGKAHYFDPEKEQSRILKTQITINAEIS